VVRLVEIEEWPGKLQVLNIYLTMLPLDDIMINWEGCGSGYELL